MRPDDRNTDATPGPEEPVLLSNKRTIELTDVELDELSQFLFWIEDRTLEGAPWWPGEDETVRFDQGPLAGAVKKVHHAWRVQKGSERDG